ncbi:Hypothetical predicted protein [Podarcis lilfordi]|uniref:Uncharacterized protein n=1 Tax=Podarcis lilfordi TaxID=74358 RepID=A0AA35L9G4_9SAUR|nr:Hypothetical predicted protein [Podarcis lilfordi]
MERMEVEPSGAGGALRRSNSAPLLPGSCGTPPRKEEPAGPPRSRRSSVCLDSGLGVEAMSETLPRVGGPPSSRAPPGGLHGSSPGPGTSYGFSSPPSAVTPHAWHLQRRPSSPSTRTPPRLETLKRKGGLDIDSPPKKLFVAGVPLTPPAP